MFVISRNSTFTYKGKPVKVQQVSKELGVRYVLEGSVQKSGGRIRINVQLIDAIRASTYGRIVRPGPEGHLRPSGRGHSEDHVGDVRESDRREQARAWAEGTKSLEAYLKLMQGREYLLTGIGRAMPWHGAWRRKRSPWIPSTQRPLHCWVRPT